MVSLLSCGLGTFSASSSRIATEGSGLSSRFFGWLVKQFGIDCRVEL